MLDIEKSYFHSFLVWIKYTSTCDQFYEFKDIQILHDSDKTSRGMMKIPYDMHFQFVKQP